MGGGEKKSHSTQTLAPSGKKRGQGATLRVIFFSRQNSFCSNYAAFGVFKTRHLPTYVGGVHSISSSTSGQNFIIFWTEGGGEGLVFFAKKKNGSQSILLTRYKFFPQL